MAGERAAREAYVARGYRVVASNWRCPLGELDLVVARDGLVVFCEVKARGSPLAAPHEAVGVAKRRKVRAVAEAFLASTNRRASAYRFDVASVTVAGGAPHVHLYEDAF